MKNKVGLLVSIFLVLAVTVCAAQSIQTYSTEGPDAVAVTTQKFAAGWDNFSEPLNLASSNVKWSVSAARKMTVTFNLVGAAPNKLYQVGIHLFCTNAPGSFAQFPTTPTSGACGSITRQGKTATVASVEMAVILTDLHGKGSAKVIVGPIASGSYDVEFTVRNGAGCNVTGGAGNSLCGIDFQSPGPFTTVTTLVVP